VTCGTQRNELKKALQKHSPKKKGNVNSDWKRGLSTLTQKKEIRINKDNLNTISNKKRLLSRNRNQCWLIIKFWLGYQVGY
jgi:hypothetical protein